MNAERVLDTTAFVQCLNMEPARELKDFYERGEGGGIATIHAEQCGVLNGYQCFLANTTSQEGQKFCRLLK